MSFRKGAASKGAVALTKTGIRRKSSTQKDVL